MLLDQNAVFSDAQAVSATAAKSVTAIVRMMCMRFVIKNVCCLVNGEQS